MSEILRFLNFFLVSAFLVSLLTIASKPVFADQSNLFTITLDPTQPSVEDQKITITITTKDGSDYFVGPEYSFAAWKGNPSLSSILVSSAACLFTNFPSQAASGEKVQLSLNKSTVTATWNPQNIIASCKNKPGDIWYFKLWAGKGLDAMNNANNIIIDRGNITFTQPGGTLVTPIAKNPDVYVNQQPIVILSNINPGSNYSFWWADDPGLVPGSIGIAAHYPENKNPDNPSEVIIPFGKFYTNEATRKLCMEYGWFSTPTGVTCRASVTFNFKTSQPPPAPSGAVKCTILPSANIPLKSEANLQIENLPNGTEIAAYARDQAKTDPEPTVNGKADSTNAVTLNILKQTSTTTPTSYIVVAYNTSDPGKNICLPNPTVIIGAAIAPPGVDKCKGPNDKDCSKAGGDPCGDKENPGFKTAIGCIHSTPKAFVEDVLKFATGIGGGLAFMMMLFGAFQMMKSAGNPQSLQEGKDVFTNAIIGILFIIFSILLMKIIGIDILNIPGFS